MYRQEEAGLREKHVDPEIRRVVLEQDLKREYQAFLQEPNRNRPDRDSAVHRRGMTGGRRRLAGIVGSLGNATAFFNVGTASRKLRNSFQRTALPAERSSSSIWLLNAFHRDCSSLS